MRYRVAALLALALVVTGCSPIDGKMVSYDSVANHVRIAASNLEQANGVRINGTVQDGRGEEIAVDVRLNGAGEGAGKIRRNGIAAQTLVVDSTTYVKAPAAWWAPDNRADTYDDVWVAVSATTIGFDPAAKLKPEALGKLVDDAFGSLQIEGMPPVTEVDKVQVRKVEATAGTLWVTAEKPYQVVRTEGSLLGPRTAVNFVITPPGPTAQIARDVALGLPALRTGSYDAYTTLQFEGALRHTCDAQGCTVTGRVRNPSDEEPVTAVLDGRVTGNRTVLGRCRSGRAEVPASAAADVSCRVTTPAWRKFYASATAPGAPMSTTKYQVTASASAIARAPLATECLRDGKGCATNDLDDGDVMDTFDRSAQAWYERTPADSELADWRRMIEVTAAGPDRVPWATDGQPTVAYLGTQGGRPFVAQFDRQDGKLVAAYGPDPAEATALRQAITGP
ncbi:hypothetical protein [Cryptosporangium phraense]|uniref:Lipoprotein n=1 Tax=Cryptosporangium phraense TaxID=2593070 RepID=A0A545AIB1_9ACTN|nr:hypothetical protein [Cryptosporangium phraense]TQS41000.1 hypothetical protein FL583_31995 [Cryptosporangium phraense]